MTRRILGPLLLPCHGRAPFQSEAQTAQYQQPTSQLRGHQSGDQGVQVLPLGTAAAGSAAAQVQRMLVLRPEG